MGPVTKVRYEERLSHDHQRDVALARARFLADDAESIASDERMFEQISTEGIEAFIVSPEDLDRILA